VKQAGAIAALGAALLAAGCGFHPLYAIPDAPKGSMQRDLGSIYVEPVPDQLGYELRNQLIDLLDARGEPAGAAYHLRVTLSEKNEAIGVQSQSAPGGITQTAITRYNDTMTVAYELVDVRTNNVVNQGTETGLSAYNVLPSPYATLVGQQDADRKAASDVADRIRIDLAVYFAQAARNK
jgi:LPS-assembly lipoprotein